MGRWARIPNDQRLCQCGIEVQTKKHVIAKSPLVHGIRSSHSNASVDFANFMASQKTARQLAMVERLLGFYEHLRLFCCSYTCIYLMSLLSKVKKIHTYRFKNLKSTDSRVWAT